MTTGDGADALGLLVEALGNQVHVTYRGTQALDVATAFRPDLMLVDLIMPDMDGCDLVMRLRQIPAFAHTKIVAITGLKDEEYKIKQSVLDEPEWYLTADSYSQIAGERKEHRRREEACGQFYE